MARSPTWFNFLSFKVQQSFAQQTTVSYFVLPLYLLVPPSLQSQRTSLRIFSLLLPPKSLLFLLFIIAQHKPEKKRKEKKKRKKKKKRKERMRALNSHLVLIDLHTSWHSANQIPTSTLTYLKNSSNFISAISSSFRRTRGARCGIASSSKSAAPEIRRPSDRFFPGNGSSSSSSPNSTSTSTSRSSELKLFLELLPPRMGRELHQHEDIGELVEVVMDLGRKPLARFPSGDWVISEHPVKHEDLRHAISKVINLICSVSLSLDI